MKIEDGLFDLLIIVYLSIENNNQSLFFKRLVGTGIQVNDGKPLVCKDRKRTRLNASHVSISCAVFCLKKKKQKSLRRSVTNRTLCGRPLGSGADGTRCRIARSRI